MAELWPQPRSYQDHAGPSVLSSDAPRAEANEKYEYLQSLIHPIVAREILSTVLGGIRPDGLRFRWPPARQPRLPNASQCTFKSAIDLARQREPFHSPVRDADGGSTRKGRRQRHASTDRRPHGAVARWRCGRRIQHHAAVPAGRARRLRAACDPGAAAPRPVPQRIRRPDVARASGPAAPHKQIRNQTVACRLATTIPYNRRQVHEGKPA